MISPTIPIGVVPAIGVEPEGTKGTLGGSAPMAVRKGATLPVMLNTGCWL